MAVERMLADGHTEGRYKRVVGCPACTAPMVRTSIGSHTTLAVYYCERLSCTRVFLLSVGGLIEERI